METLNIKCILKNKYMYLLNKIIWLMVILYGVTVYKLNQFFKDTKPYFNL